jgi:rifampicin phosphotransferase
MIPLASARLADLPIAGGKASRLGELLAAGFPVPPGFVVTAGEPIDPNAIGEALVEIGGEAFAVRSSGASEDGIERSLAGAYESILDVRGTPAVVEAVRRVRGADRDPISVLVQRLVPARSAGVAFSANPVTGEREESLVFSVFGLGVRLTIGESSGEEWSVRGDRATRKRSEDLLSVSEALQVSRLARSAADRLGAPQEIEWAIASDGLHLLQSRPITGLPDSVSWTSPHKGGWMRNFRFGEWLPEPVTPLFESWLLTRAEEAFSREHRALFGISIPPPLHVSVNGWYYCSPFGGGGPPSFLLGLFKKPRRVWSILRMHANPFEFERNVAAPLAKVWREELVPKQHAAVRDCSHGIDRASIEELASRIDRLSDFAGQSLFSMAMVGGFAWKLEAALARFFKRELAPRIGGSHHPLLLGLVPPKACPPHAVSSLDWIRPTFGELSSPANLAPRSRFEELASARSALEEKCRSALSARPREVLERLLSLAQRYAVLREEQAAELTIAWPVLRRLVLRIGGLLYELGAILSPDQIFFVTREELDRRPPDLAARAHERRLLWERQRRLVPPPVIGKVPSVLRRPIEDAISSMRISSPKSGLTGMPASPGRATGPVRLVLGSSDFPRFSEGQVLVAPILTPAWVPLFSKAAAIVSDGGSVAAHASLVAREYGIPLVVGAGGATSILSDGEIVTVDGGSGAIERL